MKTRTILVIACATMFIYSGCKDEDDGFCKRYVPGVIGIGIAEQIPTNQVFDLIDRTGGEISEMFSSGYVSAISPDSLNYVTAYLNTKPYINTGAWSAYTYIHPTTRALIVDCAMFNMTKVNQQDWLATMRILKLKEQPGVTSISLKVPARLEKYFVTLYKQQSNIRYAEMDCYMQIFPD